MDNNRLDPLIYIDESSTVLPNFDIMYRLTTLAHF